MVQKRSIIIGYFNNPNGCLFIELLTTLNVIEKNSTIKPDAKFKAVGLKEGLCKYETVLTAEIYLRIFQKTTSLSKYLQGHGVNIMASYKMVIATLNDLKQIKRDFVSVKEAANTFILWANKQLDDSDLKVNDHMPQVRKRKKLGNFHMKRLMKY